MIDAIPKDKAEQILKLVRFKMEEVRKTKNQPTQVVQSMSIADEIAKLAKLLADGLISPEEFSEMKKDLISKK
jgi:K+/H+ antiporter YhaU regulatory subunit KhtT